MKSNLSDGPPPLGRGHANTFHVVSTPQPDVGRPSCGVGLFSSPYNNSCATLNDNGIDYDSWSFGCDDGIGPSNANVFEAYDRDEWQGPRPRGHGGSSPKPKPYGKRYGHGSRRQKGVQYSNSSSRSFVHAMELDLRLHKHMHASLQAPK